jgi:glycosyltransferase involved in cell wall biosynthesis
VSFVRILYLLTSLGIGGAEKQVIGLAERMSARGHTVAVLSLKHAEEEWPAKLPVLRLNIRKTPLGIWRGLRFAVQFAVMFRPDLLHSHTYPANIFARLLKRMLPRPAPRLINTIHNVYEGGSRRMLLYRLTGFLVDQVTAVSQAAADRFVKLRAVSAAKMRVLTNGIDTGAFAPDRSRRRQMRAQMEAGKSFIWIAIGRLAPAKDYPTILESFAQLRPTHPTAQLWIAGEGDVSQLHSVNNPSDSNSNVHPLGLRRDIADLLDAADGYVLSSAWEGMPLALGEAMAMEKPVVATDVGGIRQLVGERGSIVAPKDSAALAAAMLNVMSLTEFERKAIGKAARERILQHFSIDAKALEWEQLYEQVGSGSKPA